MTKVSIKKGIITYSIIYAIFTLAVFFPFILTGKSIVSTDDTLPELYVCMHRMYDTFCSLINGRGLVTYDLSLGQPDVFLHMLIVEPITLLCAIICGKNIEIAFFVAVIIKFYLAGLFFAIWLKYTANAQNELLVAVCSMIYVYSGWGLYIGICQPIISYMLYLFPLAAYGIERVIRNDGITILVLATFLMGITGVFALYYVGIGVLLYCIYYLITGSSSVSQKMRNIITAIVGCVVGVLCSAIVLLPILYGLFNSPRMGISITTGSWLHYDIKYYAHLMFDICMPAQSISYYTISCLPTICILVLVVACFEFRKYRIEIIALLCGFIMLSIPAFGLIFGGFSSVCNRWCYVIPFIAAILSYRVFDEILDAKLPIKVVIVTTAILIVYSISWIAISGINDIPVRYGICSCACAIVLIWIYYITQAGVCTRVSGFIICFLVLLGIALNSLGFYHDNVDGWNRLFVKSGTVDASLNRFMDSKAINIDDSDTYRVEKAFWEGEQAANNSFLYSINGTAVFSSVLDATYEDFLNETGNIGLLYSHKIANLDNRTPLETLLGIRYVLSDENHIMHMPYGFEKEYDLGNNQYIFKNINYLPWGYMYTKQINAKDYDVLTPIEKQYALLDGVLCDNMSSSLENVKPRSHEQEVPINRFINDGIEYHDNGYIVVKDKSGSLGIEFSPIQNCETYLYLNGFENLCGQNMSITAVMDGLNKAIYVPKENDIYGIDRDNIIINLGCINAETCKCQLMLSHEAEFKCDSIEIKAIELDDYASRVTELEKNADVQVVDSASLYEADVKANQNGILCIPVQYSEGIKATIDGERVDCKRVNRICCGIEIEEGNHHIVMNYSNPWIGAGMVVSVLGVILYIVLRCGEIRKKRNEFT